MPDADALIRLADALDTTVQALLGQPEAPAAEPSDLAAALNRINDQLAIQNRRRSRIWRTVVWLVAVYVAFNVLLVLGYAGMALYEGETVSTTTINVEKMD